MGNQKKLIFIQGVKKTGTSTLVGILNCHPGVFILYETVLMSSWISKYGRKILTHHPEARTYFGKFGDPGTRYRGLFRFLESNYPRYQYQVIGDKVISFDPDYIKTRETHQVIYTVRDIRSWLVKEQIQRDYRTDLDIVPAAVDYTAYCMGFRLKKGSHQIKMEDMISDHESLIVDLSNMLNLNLESFTNNWWKKIGEYSSGDPKRLLDWYQGHPSSRSKPEKLDTDFELRSHDFWDDLLPLFNKYYQAPSGKFFSQEEVDEDLQRLEVLRERTSIPLQSAYNSYSTQRIGVSMKNEGLGARISNLLRRV